MASGPPYGSLLRVQFLVFQTESISVKHYVRVCRPRFEVTVLEIDADDDDQAEDIAIGEAIELPPEKWHLLAFDDGLYQPHVETCHSEDTIDANVDDPKEREEYIADLVSPERAEATNYIRYLLLCADVAHGDGHVVFEPWFAVKKSRAPRM
jgi:hypothetical protein